MPVTGTLFGSISSRHLWACWPRLRFSFRPVNAQARIARSCIITTTSAASSATRAQPRRRRQDDGNVLARRYGGNRPMKKLMEVIQKAVPVMVGASEGEREFAGTQQLAAVVRSLGDEFDFPIFLNADLAGKGSGRGEGGLRFRCVRFVHAAFEENARLTKQAVEALKSMNPAVVVEGEIGDI